MSTRANLALLLAVTSVGGCDSGVAFPGKDAGRTGDGGAIQIMGTTNHCPTVALALSPLNANVGEAVTLAASGFDSDANTALTYLWTAGAGTFGDKTSARTSYTCTAAGPQMLMVAVSDGQCTATQVAPFYCYGLPGSGGSKGTGSGGSTGTGGSGGSGGSTGSGGSSGSGGGTGGMCSGDPTGDEGAACNKCTMENCIPSTDGCDTKILITDARQQACWALYCCMRSNLCVKAEGGGGDPQRCWCGTAADAKCHDGTATANGPCAKEYAAAAETTDPALIFQRFVNPAYAVGSADNLAICRATYCSDVCKIVP